MQFFLESVGPITAQPPPGGKLKVIVILIIPVVFDVGIGCHKHERCSCRSGMKFLFFENFFSDGY